MPENHLFKSAFRAFQRAEEAAGRSIERFYSIGGYSICLRFAGPALLPIFTRALEHLTAEPTPAPSLTVCLWESASCGIEIPPLPWKKGEHPPDGRVYGYNDARIYYAAVRLGSDMINLLDAELNVAICAIRDLHKFRYKEIHGAPLLWILNWWMALHGRQLLHAGAVGRPSGGVLLAGRAGSGKSTAALACLNSELKFLSDDYCLLDISQSPPFAHSLYSSGKLEMDSIQRIPHLTAMINNLSPLDSTGEKTLIFLNEEYPEKLSSGFPIRAILLPRVTGRKETKLEPVSPIAALKALAPSTIFQLHRAGSKAFQDVTASRVFRDIAALVKRVPCFTLEMGTDLPRVPLVITRLLN
jgi:hypothetical protein